MSDNELQFIFALFSVVAVIGIIFYILIEKTKIENLEENIDILNHNLISLQEYIYELEERVNNIKKIPQRDELKDKILKPSLP